MALTMIGGLCASPMLTLLVIPAAYGVFDRRPWNACWQEAQP
jgi:Cu/Ag efflux pump CusA